MNAGLVNWNVPTTGASGRLAVSGTTAGSSGKPVAIGDPAGARVVLREARDILRLRPDLGTLGDQAEKLRAAVDALQDGAVGASSLTAAELRLVPLLATHLTFPEIGERLYISRHTVKTHAISIYRKLGVASRSEAVDRMAAAGLLRP